MAWAISLKTKLSPDESVQQRHNVFTIKPDVLHYFGVLV